MTLKYTNIKEVSNMINELGSPEHGPQVLGVQQEALVAVAGHQRQPLQNAGRLR